MMSRNAETSRRFPAGSNSPTRLPFAFARDQQVLLDGARVIAGPAATQIGLREAQRRLGLRAGLELSETDQAGFEAALARVYNDGADSGQGGDPELLFDLEDIGAGARQRDLLDDPSDAPVIQLVNRLLKRAVLSGASDLHVEPHENGLRVRMRVDGLLQEVMAIGWWGHLASDLG